MIKEYQYEVFSGNQLRQMMISTLMMRTEIAVETSVFTASW